MPFLTGRRLFDSCRETGAVQHLPVLARAGGRQTGVAQNGGLVSGNRKGPLVQIDTAAAQARKMREAYPHMYD